MTTFTILQTDQGVAGRQNRQGADHGEPVTWEFIPNTEAFQVVFIAFQSPGASSPGPLPLTSLFSTELRAATQGRVQGTVDSAAEPGLYFYEIHDSNGQVQNWLNPVNGTPSTIVGGGLDVPKPSPAGGGAGGGPEV